VSDFFGQLAKQLAGRWLSLLAIPGVLFLAVGWTALQLGHAHAVDTFLLADAIGRTATEIASWPGAVQALAVVGLILAVATVGLVVQAMVGPVRLLSLGQWPRGLRGLSRLLIRRRLVRWHELTKERAALETVHPERNRTADHQHRIERITGRINQIAMAEPGRPTWMGDRMYALNQVAQHRYGLDLNFSWPRLWLVLPDNVRTEITTAQGGFATAMFTTTWALPYLTLGLVWWPATLIGVVIAAVAWSRARDRIATLTELVESALDIHARDLAIILGVAEAVSTGPLTRDEGEDITDIARKGR
jgi:hypothetical protein